MERLTAVAGEATLLSFTSRDRFFFSFFGRPLLAPLNLLLFLHSCSHRPRQTEFTKITSKTALGFVVMGFIGFFVKLIFIVSFSRVYFVFFVVPKFRPVGSGTKNSECC